MKILMVASEAAPFAKTGGLADVVGLDERSGVLTVRGGARAREVEAWLRSQRRAA